MSTATADAHSDAHSEHAHAGGFLRTYVFSLDHKIIGMQFLFSTLIWFFVGGMLAMGIRWQLAYPWRISSSLFLFILSAEDYKNKLEEMRQEQNTMRVAQESDE